MAPLLNESGGHRWQRVPPTETKGRIHTSTVTVAVLKPLAQSEWKLKDSEIEVFTTRDSGPGGQHRNTSDTCVVMRHKRTGITVKIAEKSQHRNRIMAREILEARIKELKQKKDVTRVNKERKDKVGSGMRGDKIRTYREKDNRVVDHRTNKKVSLEKIKKGSLEILW